MSDPASSAARVAVVIPCFNDGATLAEAVASVEAERPAELVVVDDGSSDEHTLAELELMRRRGVSVISQENHGLAAARMAGVNATSAPFVFPLDADDVLIPGALATLTAALDGQDDLAAAWGDLEIFGEFGTAIETASRLDPWLLTFIDDVPAWALIRRTALLDVGGWTLTTGNEDWDLWLALVEAGWQGVRVPHTTVRYRRHGQRLSATWLANRRRHLADLAQRHPTLFHQRRSTWRRSNAPWRVRLTYPLIAALPLDERNKYRLYLFLRRPRQHLRVRRLRRRATRGQ